MTSTTESISKTGISRSFNWRLFLQDNLTGSWYLTVGVAFLAYITVSYAYRQFDKSSTSTIIVLAAWFLCVLLVVLGELFHRHTGFSRWLKRNLINSVSNALLTLLLSLVLVAAANSIWHWGVVNASFDPTRTAPGDRPENGATWGVIIGAKKLLATGLLEPNLSWRVWLALGFILALWAATYIGGRSKLRDALRDVRRITNGLWLLSPVILYIFLAGVPSASFNILVVLVGAALVVAVYILLWLQKVVRFSWPGFVGMAVLWPVSYTIWWGIGQSEIFPPINVDLWGGMMLTLVIASAVIVLSLPLGMVLALGRRSQVYGIPDWIIWPAAIGATIWGFTTTPQLLADARNTVELILAFWPIMILGLAYFIQRTFKGNIVAAASTIFIELIRSVPLITLLFMGIVMAPFFFATGVTPAKPWPVIVGYTLFSSAYMAETIRGGLQAIPKGQYEAADALGFNTLQKMRFIILPQALRIVIPPIVGLFIGAYKSSSLVSIVGLFDLLGIQRVIIANPEWLGLRIELYIFMGILYFLGSSVMSAYSRRLEVRLGLGER